MRAVRALLIAVCCYGAVYGCWGAFSESGKSAYDGVSVLIPYYVMLGSVSMLGILGLYYLVITIVKRNNK